MSPRTMILSVGVDLVDVREVEASIGRFGDRYLERVFTPGELASACGESASELARRLGARFAAKEATMKALGETAGGDGVDWRAIEVVRAPSGEPRIVLSGWAERARVQRRITSLAVSLTHEGDFAAAVVVATRSGVPSRLSSRPSKPWRERD